MTPARVIDTQRLSTLAHEYEREILRFHRDLAGDRGGIERIRQEVEKAAYAEIRVDSVGNLFARMGSGKYTIVMNAQGAAGAAGMIYGGRLVHELGIYDDFTLWVSSAARLELPILKAAGIDPHCALVAEPTNLCIKMREAALEGFLSESHPLVEAAISTYETLFELPPILSQSPSPTGPLGVPAIAFGPGEEGAETVPTRHLLKAAQFYAAFPTMFVDTMKRQ